MKSVVLAGLCLAFEASAAPQLVLHLDMKAAAWRREALSRMLKDAKADGYDAILWEVEDKVRWASCPEVAHPEAMDKAEFRKVLDEARGLGLEPIPLLQTVGHAEYVMAREKYRGFREKPDNRTCYCVSKPEVRAFLRRYLAEMLDLFGPEVKQFHLGGDEARVFATCPVCSKCDKGRLYAEHLEGLAALLRARGVRPACWCDMLLRDLGKGGAGLLPTDWSIWHWDYSIGVSEMPVTEWTSRLPELLERGYKVMFCCATQCYGDGPFLVDWNLHARNVAASAEMVRTNRLEGLCVTSWSVRGAPKAVQRPLFSYAAKCLRQPGGDKARLWADCRGSFFGRDADALAELGVYDVKFLQFDVRDWRRHFDPSVSNVPPVRPTHELADRIRAHRARFAAARERVKADAGLLLVAHVLRGAALTDAWLKALEDYQDGESFGFSEMEAAKWYSDEEETPESAVVSARMLGGFAP